MFQNIYKPCKLSDIVGVSKTKTRKATSDLCTFMGIPHHSRSEISTIISKFIKLYSARMFQALDRDQLEQQKAATSATPWTYLNVGKYVVRCSNSSKRLS
ncbi:hypothetical protein P8452_51146 [Trifolium repens]|nr:hypothetical protein P8452_51146 [Trifolium repens]